MLSLDRWFQHYPAHGLTLDSDPFDFVDLDDYETLNEYTAVCRVVVCSLRGPFHHFDLSGFLTVVGGKQFPGTVVPGTAFNVKTAHTQQYVCQVSKRHPTSNVQLLNVT